MTECRDPLDMTPPAPHMPVGEKPTEADLIAALDRVAELLRTVEPTGLVRARALAIRPGRALA